MVGRGEVESLSRLFSRSRVQVGEVESLSRLFSRSRVQVWRALTFRDDHAMARRIRKAAIERGGIEVGK